MNTELLFLTKYGLHNYVTYSRSSNESVFYINGTENKKMVSHARNIISEMFGGTPTIMVK